MDHAADALVHYFNGLGDTLEYLEADTCELISSSQNNLDHLHRNITRTIQCAEQILCDNQRIMIATKSDSGFKATCNVDRGSDDGGISCDIMNDGNASHHTCGIHFNYVNRDWFNTVGEAGANVVAEITRSGNTYTMNYSYSFLDIYEWAYHYDGTMLYRILHSYHEDGWAQEFLMEGKFIGTLTWQAGDDARQMDVVNQIKETLKSKQNPTRWDKSNEYD